MISNGLWSLGICRLFLIFKQTEGLITGKTSFSPFPTTGLKASPSCCYLQLFSCTFSGFWNSKPRITAHTQQKKKAWTEQSKILFQLRRADTCKIHREHGNMAGLGYWSGQSFCSLEGRAKLHQKAQTMHTAPPGDTGRGRVWNLNCPFKNIINSRGHR